MPVLGEVMNYVTPLAPDSPTSAPVMPTPPHPTDSLDFYKHLSPVKSFPLVLKTVFPVISTPSQHATEAPDVPTYGRGDNITVFTLDDIDSPFKTIHPEPHLMSFHDNWQVQHRKPEPPQVTDLSNQTLHMHAEHIAHINRVNEDAKLYDYRYTQPNLTQRPPSQSKDSQKVPIPHSQSIDSHKIPVKSVYEKIKKIPISKVDNLNYFIPSLKRRPISESSFPKSLNGIPKTNTWPEFPKHQQKMFEPSVKNSSVNYHVPNVILAKSSSRDPSQLRKHVTILNTKDFKSLKPTERYHEVLWHDDTKAHHVLTKEPNPYETVLLRPVANAKLDAPSSYSPRSRARMPGKSPSALDLEHLLNQMEVESVVNKNLGRSAVKDPGDSAGLLPRLGVSFMCLLDVLMTDCKL